MICNIAATIKEFVENNNIECKYDVFSEYLSIDPYDIDSDSNNNESEKINLNFQLKIIIYYIMNFDISKIPEIIEDTKEIITKNQYKIIMDNLMKIKLNYLNFQTKFPDQRNRQLTEEQSELIRNVRIIAEEIEQQQRVRSQEYKSQCLEQKQQRRQQRTN